MLCTGKIKISEMIDFKFVSKTILGFFKRVKSSDGKKTFCESVHTLMPFYSKFWHQFIYHSVKQIFSVVPWWLPREILNFFLWIKKFSITFKFNTFYLSNVLINQCQRYKIPNLDVFGENLDLRFLVPFIKEA